MPFTEPMAAQGAHDRNADGYSDLAFGSPLPDAPLFYVLGGATAVPGGATPTFGGYDPVVETRPLPTRAMSFASGDFDGDGLADLAFVTTQDGKPAVCFMSATEPEEKVNVVCHVPAAAPAGFAASIIACDVDGDGRDEVLVGSTSEGVDILRRTANTVLAEHLATAHGTQLATVHPGRPGAAVWAATRADGTSVAIFKGTASVTTLAPFGDASRFGRFVR